jgi:hypothetical protein
MKIAYEHTNFRSDTLVVIDQVNAILEEYAEQGYDNLTLRQVFYQLVSRDLIPNSQDEYKKLGKIISNGRRAGLIDWGAIIDRTRNLETIPSWSSPAAIVSSAAESFQTDWWKYQKCHIEIFFEKDALIGIFERIAQRWRLPYFSCRGYASDSEIWAAAQRFNNIGEDKEEVIILHFGDHDPSGIDMSRDIADRLRLFHGSDSPDVKVKRLALNFDQIKLYNPPPNPAKKTDVRYADYKKKYGNKSWELDALDPPVLDALVADFIDEYIDKEEWEMAQGRESDGKAELGEISKKYAQVKQFIKGK